MVHKEKYVHKCYSYFLEQPRYKAAFPLFPFSNFSHFFVFFPGKEEHSSLRIISLYYIIPKINEEEKGENPKNCTHTTKSLVSMKKAKNAEHKENGGD